jgi:TPR repeat protein
MKTLHDVLDVRADDDAESVSKAFRNAVRANHPDLSAGDPDARSRLTQIVRVNAILRDPELQACVRLPEFEEQQCRPQSKLVAISNTAHRTAADTIFACVLAFVMAAGAYKLFTYLSKASDVTAHGSVTVAAVPPQAPVDAAGRLKTVGPRKSFAAAFGTPSNVAAEVKNAVDAVLGRPRATAAPPPPRPFIAGERRDAPEGADAVAPNGQTPTANRHESLSLAGSADGTRSPDKRLLDTRVVQLDPDTPTVQPLDSEQAAKLLEQGRELLRTGDIAAARVAFQRLADTGNVEAALALAKTFDPRFLAQHYITGVFGDEAKARAWYQRAMELGSTEAKDILAHMGRPKATAAPPPPRPVIAGERRDEPEGAGAVAPNGQTPTANNHESLVLAGLADGTRSPDKRLPDTRTVPLGPKTAAIQPLDSEQATKLLEQGRELLRTGDIAAARVAFQRLAEAGNVEAALALGKTFDPRFLAQHYVIGVVGDEAKARAWYQRAMELGSTEAKGILAQMATK